MIKKYSAPAEASVPGNLLFKGGEEGEMSGPLALAQVKAQEQERFLQLQMQNEQWRVLRIDDTLTVQWPDTRDWWQRTMPTWFGGKDAPRPERLVVRAVTNVDVDLADRTRK